LVERDPVIAVQVVPEPLADEKPVITNPLAHMEHLGDVGVVKSNIWQLGITVLLQVGGLDPGVIVYPKAHLAQLPLFRKATQF